MNTRIVVDTSGLISLASPTDRNHSRAVAASDRVRAAKHLLIVPGEVFTETVNTLGKKTGHAVAGAVGRWLLSADTFVVVETTPALRTAAMERFGKLSGGVSLTDCFVMATADQYGTQDIFGFDAVFAKNGYRLPGEGEAA